jgi:hypothetical protein
MLNAHALASHRAPPALPIDESAPPSLVRSALPQVAFRAAPHPRAFSVSAAAPGRMDEDYARAVIRQATDLPDRTGVLCKGARDTAHRAALGA